MKVFEVPVQELKFGDRLVPLCYYYSKFVKEENMSKGIVQYPMENIQLFQETMYREYVICMEEM